MLWVYIDFLLLDYNYQIPLAYDDEPGLGVYNGRKRLFLYRRCGIEGQPEQVVISLISPQGFYAELTRVSPSMLGFQQRTVARGC